MNILLANIWNRNIRYNWDFIEKSYDKQDKKSEKVNFFDFTKMLYEDIENEKVNLRIEIIDSIINEYKIDKIYLFTTYQEEPFSQDTFYEAKIIEYLLKDKYKIEIIQYKNDPRIRDEVFKFYEDFFQKNKDLEKYNLIISWSWWVPAMKEALNFYWILKNTANSKIVDVDEKTKSIFSSEIQNEYLKNFDKNILKEMILKYNYSWAYLFLKNSRIKDIQLENYLLYASNRYNFNFEDSNNILKNIKRCKFWEIKTSYNSIEEKINYQQNMIVELFDNLEITFEKWEYTMFLWKTFSLQENITRYLFEKEYNIDSEKDFDELKNIGLEIKESKQQKKYVEIYSLKEKLNEKFTNSNQEFKEFKEFNDNLNKLKELRNNSIVAHWFWWISRWNIIDFNKKIILFKEKFFWIKTNIFHKINEELLKLIK